MFYEGASLTAMGRALGVSRQTVANWLVEWDLYDPRPRLTRRQREQMVAWEARNVPLATIAGRLGIDERNVRWWLRRLDVPPRRRRVTEEERARIVELYGDEEKRPIGRIAREVGRPQATVRAVLIRAGVYDAARSAATRPSLENHPWKRWRL